MFVIQFELIELLTFFEKGNYLWFTERFKVWKFLHTKHVTYLIRDTKDEEILGSFYYYELRKVKNN